MRVKTSVTIDARVLKAIDEATGNVPRAVENGWQRRR
jgi:hypothetical protein